ncbi:hypothetical protein CVT26_006592 [Gymnopilus dilepis]|uniref:Uncharacterized protein n=1 Tax=Gymnopilus dilepis TaxID=231916 RepID=A0A409Y2Z6_9AGAR|nr:hypothetical protein CVT26_006592 [Gymnopilus dilepis]
MGWLESKAIYARKNQGGENSGYRCQFRNKRKSGGRTDKKHKGAILHLAEEKEGKAQERASLFIAPGTIHVAWANPEGLEVGQWRRFTSLSSSEVPSAKSIRSEGRSEGRDAHIFDDEGKLKEFDTHECRMAFRGANRNQCSAATTVEKQGGHHSTQTSDFKADADR